MRIIKHGDYLDFTCEDCGCKWYASKKECKYITHDATMLPSEWGYRCPDCGKWNTTRHEVKGEEANG